MCILLLFSVMERVNEYVFYCFLPLLWFPCITSKYHNLIPNMSGEKNVLCSYTVSKKITDVFYSVMISWDIEPWRINKPGFGKYQVSRAQLYNKGTRHKAKRKYYLQSRFSFCIVALILIWGIMEIVYHASPKSRHFFFWCAEMMVWKN